MKETFDEALRFVFGEEGGYSNDPNDAGGKTNLGITQGTLTSAHMKGIVSHSDIKKLTKAEAISIYKALYWQAAHCDEHPYPIDVLVFDIAVNCGVGTSLKMLQSAISWVTGIKLTTDGIFGRNSKAAFAQLMTANSKVNLSVNQVLGVPAEDILLKSLGLALLAERTEYYVAITDGVAATQAQREQEIKNRTFFRGWISNRVEKLTDKYLGI